MPKETETTEKRRSASSSRTERLTPVEITRRGAEPPSQASASIRPKAEEEPKRTAASVSSANKDRTGTHLRGSSDDSRTGPLRSSDRTGTHLKITEEPAPAAPQKSAGQAAEAPAAEPVKKENKKVKEPFWPRKKKLHDPVPVRSTPKEAPPNPAEEKKKKVRIRRREQRSGFTGGLMYFLFLASLSVCIAVFTWMAVNDLMSLNKGSFSATITLPASEFTTETITVTDASGDAQTKEITHANFDFVANELYNAGLIQYKWLFRAFCNLSNADVKFSPGEYELKSSYDYRALVQNMRAGSGGVSTVTVTIPEGFTMLDIFERFEENHVASVSDLLEAARTGSFSYDFLAGTEDEGESRLEGYLYPDTYEFYVGMEPSSAINKLLNNFYYKYTADMITQTQNQGTTVQDIIKIASIIEKEAQLDDDRAYVSSVIYNRLRAGMSLGMDTTILYLHQDHEGEPTYDMLNEDSPYNTHIYTGLPPTAICNPGMASILAALNPAESDYYYFYADIDTGKLNFFTNYNDFTNYINSLNG